MNKIINFEKLLLFKTACKKLEENNISFNKEKLKESEELCSVIIQLLERYE